MAAAAWWLLGREADRVESLAAGTLANRTATVAESIDLLMGEVRDGVVDGLRSVREAPDPRRALAGLVEGNPYIATGFYFRGSDSVTVWFGKRGSLPAPGSILSEPDKPDATETNYPWTLSDFEETRSPPPDTVALARRGMDMAKAPSDAYAPDLSEDQNSIKPERTQAAGDEPEPTESLPSSLSKNIALKEQRAAVRQVNVENQLSLRRRSRPNVSKADAPSVGASVGASGGDAMTDSFVRNEGFADAQNEAEVPVPTETLAEPVPGSVAASVTREELIRQGWVRPDVAGETQWLAWMGLPGGRDYLGAWLDREAILAELSKAIHLSQQDGLHFRLIDGAGGVVAGDRKPRYGSTKAMNAELSIAVGSRLPQWRIEAFRANTVNGFGQSFRWVGGLFIVGLSLAIFTGASVLIWQARRDAREAERKTTFVANVSHELKTPLTSIRLFADMLHDGRVKDEAKQRQYLQTMVNETQRLTRLVNNVLDFSRLERGRRRKHLESFDLGETVAEIIKVQQDRLLADGLSVTFDCPKEPKWVRLDRDALEQVLLNLLDNAAKYAASGERAAVRLRPTTDGFRLEVRDFGPGIPPSERKQVFAAFHRSDDRLTTERPGCGLGLSIAARLAAEMGGHLTLEANQPTGCLFILNVHA